jgi:hypothetical protein
MYTNQMNTNETKNQAKEIVNAKCRRIRQGWSDSERHLRELQASLAQSRLALTIMFRDLGCAGAR